MANDIILLTYADEKHPSAQDVLVKYPHAKVISISSIDVFKKIQNAVNTSSFWLVMPNMDVALTLFDFEPDEYEKKVINLFGALNSDAFLALNMSRMQFNRLIITKKIQSIFDLFSLEVKIHQGQFGNDLSQINSYECVHLTYENMSIPSVNLNEDNHLIKLANLKSKYIWIIFPNIDVDDNELNFIPDASERDMVNIFKANNIDDVSAIFIDSRYLTELIETQTISSVFDLCNQNIKIHITKKGQSILDILNYDPDIILISYFDSNADLKFNKMREDFGDRVKWIKDVRGIVDAHTQASKISSTHSFYVVDSDAQILPSFKFDFNKNGCLTYNAVYVWKSKNSVNDLEYGYGGIKMFNKFHFKQIDSTFDSVIDFTSTIGALNVVDEVACITVIDESSLSAWRSAFREAAKLSKNTDNESTARLRVWCNFAHGPFALYTIHGANAGKEYGSKCKNNELNKINDFEWLESEFRSYFGF